MYSSMTVCVPLSSEKLCTLRASQFSIQSSRQFSSCAVSNTCNRWFRFVWADNTYRLLTPVQSVQLFINLKKRRLWKIFTANEVHIAGRYITACQKLPNIVNSWQPMLCFWPTVIDLPALITSTPFIWSSCSFCCVLCFFLLEIWRLHFAKQNVDFF